MPVPSDGHENVRQRQEADGFNDEGIGMASGQWDKKMQEADLNNFSDRLPGYAGNKVMRRATAGDVDERIDLQ